MKVTIKNISKYFSLWLETSSKSFLCIKVSHAKLCVHILTHVWKYVQVQFSNRYKRNLRLYSGKYIHSFRLLFYRKHFSSIDFKLYLSSQSDINSEFQQSIFVKNLRLLSVCLCSSQNSAYFFGIVQQQKKTVVFSSKRLGQNINGLWYLNLERMRRCIGGRSVRAMGLKLSKAAVKT